MLAALQGRRPDHVGIILGDGEQNALQVSDFWFYYKAIRRTERHRELLI
jgi:hypothetical protein